jgi:hypothetical protein
MRSGATGAGRDWGRKAVVATAVAGAVAASQWLGRTSGSTRAERRRPLPGDELVDRPTVVTNHAITIPAHQTRCGRGLSRWAGTAAAGTPPAGSTGCCSRPTGPAPPDLFPTCSGSWRSATHPQRTTRHRLVRRRATGSPAPPSWSRPRPPWCPGRPRSSPASASVRAEAAAPRAQRSGRLRCRLWLHEPVRRLRAGQRGRVGPHHPAPLDLAVTRPQVSRQPRGPGRRTPGPPAGLPVPSRWRRAAVRDAARGLEQLIPVAAIREKREMRWPRW